MTKLAIAFVILLFSTAANAQSSHHSHDSHMSEYKGQENRKIKSLSAKDIQDLSEGKGWGFAKAAELNGVPGPLHLLELKADIPLSESETTQINLLFEEMKAQASKLGKQLVALEASLEDGFRKKSLSLPELRSTLQSISQVRAELRYTHLSAHIKTLKILSTKQIERYNTLRGYDNVIH